MHDKKGVEIHPGDTIKVDGVEGEGVVQQLFHEEGRLSYQLLSETENPRGAEPGEVEVVMRPAAELGEVGQPSGDMVVGADPAEAPPNQGAHS